MKVAAGIVLIIVLALAVIGFIGAFCMDCMEWEVNEQNTR